MWKIGGKVTRVKNKESHHGEQYRLNLITSEYFHEHMVARTHPSCSSSPPPPPLPPSPSSVYAKLFLCVSQLRESRRKVPQKHELPTAAGLGTDALLGGSLQHGCAAGSEPKGEKKFTSRAFCAFPAHFLRICEVCGQQRV